MGSKKIILLPGMGADARLFEPQRAAFPALIVPPWLKPERRESLPAYARRMAEAIQRDGHIAGGERFVLGGVSFGGMLALEMARHLRPEAVVLIGSCRTGAAIPRFFRAAYRFARLMPRPLIRPNRVTIPLIMGSMGAPRDPRYRRFLEGLRDTPVEFMLWTSGAILSWRPAPLPDIPIHHIHGRRDVLIPLRRLDPPPDAVIDGGIHLISLTNPEEVNSFLRRIIDG